MWAPNSGVHLASIFCHSSHVLDAGVTRDGHYLATIGSDSKLNVFDLRTYGLVHSYFTPMPASCVSISQRGLLSIACRDQVITWRDWEKERQKAPYLKQETTERRKIVDLQYAPFEDSLGVGEIGGFEMISVPGAGEANFDSFESGIGLSKKAKSTALVRGLLEKVQTML
jgi:U3 small nucleolar RNA-associated protein 7